MDYSKIKASAENHQILLQVPAGDKKFMAAIEALPKGTWELGKIGADSTTIHLEASRQAEDLLIGLRKKGAAISENVWEVIERYGLQQSANQHVATAATMASPIKISPSSPTPEAHSKVTPIRPILDTKKLLDGLDFGDLQEEEDQTNLRAPNLEASAAAQSPADVSAKAKISTERLDALSEAAAALRRAEALFRAKELADLPKELQAHFTSLRQVSHKRLDLDLYNKNHMTVTDQSITVNADKGVKESIDAVVAMAKQMGWSKINIDECPKEYRAYLEQQLKSNGMTLAQSAEQAVKPGPNAKAQVVREPELETAGPEYVNGLENLI